MLTKCGVLKRGEGNVVYRCKMFLSLKISLKRVAFSNSGRNSVTRELNNISKTAFLEGMKMFKELANRCIDQGGMYFEE
jgi:hypothetical protein